MTGQGRPERRKRLAAETAAAENGGIMRMMISASSSRNSVSEVFLMQQIRKILTCILWIVLLLLLSSCVTERIEKRPVYHFAFAPEEEGGRRLGRRYTREERQRLKRTQYNGKPEVRHEQFVPARLEHFQGNPQLMR